jgi:hypothetical protein
VPRNSGSHGSSEEDLINSMRFIIKLVTKHVKVILWLIMTSSKVVSSFKLAFITTFMYFI